MACLHPCMLGHRRLQCHLRCTCMRTREGGFAKFKPFTHSPFPKQNSNQMFVCKIKFWGRRVSWRQSVPPLPPPPLKAHRQTHAHIIRCFKCYRIISALLSQKSGNPPSLMQTRAHTHTHTCARAYVHMRARARSHSPKCTHPSEWHASTHGDTCTARPPLDILACAGEHHCPIRHARCRAGPPLCVPGPPPHTKSAHCRSVGCGVHCVRCACCCSGCAHRRRRFKRLLPRQATLRFPGAPT